MSYQTEGRRRNKQREVEVLESSRLQGWDDFQLFPNVMKITMKKRNREVPQVLLLFGMNVWLWNQTVEEPRWGTHKFRRTWVSKVCDESRKWKQSSSEMLIRTWWTSRHSKHRLCSASVMCSRRHLKNILVGWRWAWWWTATPGQTCQPVSLVSRNTTVSSESPQPAWGAKLSKPQIGLLTGAQDHRWIRNSPRPAGPPDHSYQAAFGGCLKSHVCWPDSWHWAAVVMESSPEGVHSFGHSEHGSTYRVQVVWIHEVRGGLPWLKSCNVPKSCLKSSVELDCRETCCCYSSTSCDVSVFCFVCVSVIT